MTMHLIFFALASFVAFFLVYFGFSLGMHEGLNNKFEESANSSMVTEVTTTTMSAPVDLKVGDRVRYYGMFNEHLEVTKATVTQVNGDALEIECDKGCNDDGKLVVGPVSQWAHRKQLRKLKTGPAASTQSDQ